MKRLLCIVNSMNAGGAETFLMKVYRNTDKSQYQFDFCVSTPEESFYEKEIIEMGGRVFRIPPKSVAPITSFKALKSIVREQQYDYVMRVNEHSLSAIDLLAARVGGAHHLIMRSSNASSGSCVKKITHKMFRFLPKLIPTMKIAPSTEAAEYTFGKGCVKKGIARLLHNAVDLEQFRFDLEQRKIIRAQLGITNQFVIGHVGRFNTQKNHQFLIKVFADIRKKKQNDAVLLLVGNGNLKDEIIQQVKDLGLENAVIFAGVQKDIPLMLSAMDVFAFPSLYEGMPNTVIEAQAMGLPCVISDTITREADITGLVQYLSIKDDVSKWADAVIYTKGQPRKDTRQDFIKHGYDIKTVSTELLSLIFEPQNEKRKGEQM